MKYIVILCESGVKKMSSIKNITASNSVPIDLAKRIGEKGVGIILVTMWLSYYDLKKDKIVMVDTDEDSITVEWYAKIYNRWTEENRAAQINTRLIPYNQYPDNTLKKKKGKAPTIDFCFRAWDKNEGYFGAECKRLRSDQIPLIEEYVENGVKRYTSGKYSSKSSASAMIGYVQQGKIVDIVELLKPIMSTANLEENLLRMILEKSPQYRSRHIRDLDNQVITLYHLFFDFVA